MNISAMFAVVGILRETIKVLSKCRHAIIIIGTISILFNFLLLFANPLFTKPYLNDLLRKETFMLLTNPQDPKFLDLLLQVKRDVWFLGAIHSAILFISHLVFLFVMMAIILVISTAYKGKSISFEELLHRLASTCIKPFITLFYITMYSIGYMFSVLAVLVLITLSVNTVVAAKTVAISVGLVAAMLWIHLYVVWVLGLVVSVVQENCYGIEALGKASKLVEGKRLDGYLLNVIAFIGSVSIFLCSNRFLKAESILAKIVFGFLALVISYVMQVFLYSTYTVFYFQCKGIDDEEEVELKGSFQYSKVPSLYTPPV